MGYVKWFGEVGLDGVDVVGGKNASLGEMYQELTDIGVRVPNGFATTADLYRKTLHDSGTDRALRALFADVDKSDLDDLSARAREARVVVYGTPLPAQAESELGEAYEQLAEEYGPDMTVAVRSSATAEDLPTASFAGQHETFLNVQGAQRVVEAVRRCFASLYTDRAISYRIDQGFDHFDIAISAGIMKMVRSDLASSGVMFTVDTESGHPDVVFITSSYGLGENIVQGTVDPDEMYVHKPTFEAGHRAILRRKLGDKKIRMVYAQGRGGQPTANVPTSPEERKSFSITDDEALALAGFGIEVERHYSAHTGRRQPMDIEWAKDGLDGELYLVQARPETVVSQKTGDVIRTVNVRTVGEKPLTSGRAVGTAAASGTARKVSSVDDLSRFANGEVLVADTTNPDWEPVMKSAAAIVTNRGGRTCHAAIVARELGIPAVVGTGDATEVVADGQLITVSCAMGDVGAVFEGALDIEVEEVVVSDVPATATGVMMNIGNPDMALEASMLPVDGVGLARMEFIILESIKAHPLALLYPDRVESLIERDAISALTSGYPSSRDFFVERLSEGVGTIAAAFFPRPVIVRMSDFKTNEYSGLLGGTWFEPVEENPMIGFRGAARYVHPAYEDGFAMECDAIRRVRDEMGLTNLKLMIPFCRRIEEADAVLESLEAHGLGSGKSGLEIYVMAEVPNNVVQVGAFAQRFDGFSIGSNDLTQLVLGVDRDSELVAFDFDERDAGVLEMIRQTIAGAHANDRPVGICGQAPSDYPEFARQLVEWGIDTISVTPDSVLQTRFIVADAERSVSSKDSVSAS